MKFHFLFMDVMCLYVYVFWEIPQEEVAKALTWALQLVRGRRQELQWFCLHRRGVKKLHRLGGEIRFSRLEEEEVRYVLFDIEDNTLLYFGRLVLRQGGKRVPVGGFLSAQLAEIWCSWREATWVFGESKGTWRPHYTRI